MRKYSNYYLVLWCIITMNMILSVILISYDYGHVAVLFITTALILFMVGVNTHHDDMYRE